MISWCLPEADGDGWIVIPTEDEHLARQWTNSADKRLPEYVVSRIYTSASGLKAAIVQIGTELISGSLGRAEQYAVIQEQKSFQENLCWFCVKERTTTSLNDARYNLAMCLLAPATGHPAGGGGS